MRPLCVRCLPPPQHDCTYSAIEIDEGAGAVSAEDDSLTLASSVPTAAFSTSSSQNAITMHWWHEHGDEAFEAFEGSDVRITKAGTIGSLSYEQHAQEARHAAQAEKPNVIAIYLPKLDHYSEETDR